MTNEKKDRLLKISIILCLVFIVVPSICAVLNNFYPMELFDILTKVGFGILAVVAVIFLMLFFGMKREPEPPESYQLSYQSGEEIVAYLQRVLNQNGYEYQKEIILTESAQASVYCKKKKRKELECFAIVKTLELTDDILEILDEKITQFFIDYYGTDRISDTLDLFTVVYAEHQSETFWTFVDSCGDLGPKRYMSPAGILLEDMKLYVTHLSDFTPEKHLHLRKELLQIFGIQAQKK